MTSRKKNVWIFICCVVALLILIFFEPAYGWRVREWLSPERSVAIQAGQNQTDADNQALAAQNETLDAELTQLQSVMAQIPQNPQNQIRAMVYLQYPFGFKNELLVSAGSNEGVQMGSAVTFQGIFIGSVIQVFPESAVVQTVFDPSLKMPVRIGDGNVSYDGLLLGGADPKATSIAKEAIISSGDIVYTAAPGLPYGLPVGMVNATSTSADNLFQEASLNFIYDVGSIQTVLIER